MADTLTRNVMAPKLEVQESADIVDEEKLDSRVKDYIAAMVKSIPAYSRKILGDRRHIETDIANGLPKLQGWEAEDKILKRHIHELIQSTAVANINAPMVVRLDLSPGRLFPDLLPEPHARAAVMVCSSFNGIKRQCVVPAAEGEPPPLEHMAIPSGLMLIAQLLPTIFNEHNDMRQQGTGSGMQYSERNRDPIVRGDAKLHHGGAAPHQQHANAHAAAPHHAGLEEIAEVEALHALHGSKPHQEHHEHAAQGHGQEHGAAGTHSLAHAAGAVHGGEAGEHHPFFAHPHAAGHSGAEGGLHGAAAFHHAEAQENIAETEGVEASEAAEETPENESAGGESAEEETTEEETTAEADDTEEEQEGETAETEEAAESTEEEAETEEESAEEESTEAEEPEVEEELAAEESGAEEEVIESAEAGEAAESVGEDINEANEAAENEQRIEPVTAEKEIHGEEHAEEAKSEEDRHEEKHEDKAEAREESREEHHEEKTEAREVTHEENREDRHDQEESKQETHEATAEHSHAEESKTGEPDHRTDQAAHSEPETGRHEDASREEVKEGVKEEIKESFKEAEHAEDRQEARQDPPADQAQPADHHHETASDMGPDRYEELNRQTPTTADNTASAGGPERPSDAVDHLVMEQTPSPMGTEFHQTHVNANFNVDAMPPNSDAAPNVLNMTNVPPPTSGSLAGELMKETAFHHLVDSGAVAPAVATPTKEGLAALAGTAGMQASTSITRDQMRQAAKKVRALRAKKTPQPRSAATAKTKEVALAQGKPPQAKSAQGKPNGPDRKITPGDRMG